MLTTAPKEIRENIARAMGYLRRDEVERALVTMSEALRLLAGVKLMRSARAELDIQIGEFLGGIVRHSALQPLLDPGNTGKPRSITLQAGKEATLSTVLDGLAKILETAAEQAVQQEAEARLERKKQLISSGLDFLREGQVAKGRAFLKRIVEEFGDEDGIRLQMGQIFAAAGLFAEAAAMYEEAMTIQPREASAYTGAVAAKRPRRCIRRCCARLAGMPPPLAKCRKCTLPGVKNRLRKITPCAPCRQTPSKLMLWRSWRRWASTRSGAG